MKFKAQSLVEFAVILLCVTAVAWFSLQVISNKINSNVYTNYEESDDLESENKISEETNCTKMGLHWDAKNGICEAK